MHPEEPMRHAVVFRHSSAHEAKADRTGTSQARVRKLHRGHIAFMRAVVQGLDTRESWHRYLRCEGGHDDARNVRRTVQWIRDEFAAAARRYGRHGIARLVGVDASRIPEKEFAQPSLEQYAVDHGLLDFSEAEQLESYQERYGTATPRQSRRSRLVAKQLDALLWLEGLVSQPPQPDDSLHAWLAPDLAGCLGKAGILTVRQLNERINGIGRRWYAGIASIGPAKADRIVDWLIANEATTGLSLGAHVQVKRSELRSRDLQDVISTATAVVPLDKLFIPSTLDGSQGQWRAALHLCTIDATNDRDAIFAWVAAKGAMPDTERAAIKRKRGIDPAATENKVDWLHYLTSTQRAYLKEAERFMLWAVLERKKPLSSLSKEDCEAYCRFMCVPAPQDTWYGPRGRERWSPLWRPFEGPLSQRARRQAVVILKNLYKFLVDHAYLACSSWDGVPLPQRDTVKAGRRGFTPGQWDFLNQRLDELPPTSANHRLKFAIRLLYATGLRLGEVVAARVGHLAWVSYPVAHAGDRSVEGWQLQVLEKGGAVQRVVPVPAEVIAGLSDYLRSRRLDPDVKSASNQDAFLLGKAVDITERLPWSAIGQGGIDAREGITPGTLYRQSKAFFSASANVLVKMDAPGAQCLRAASTYWLRHTCEMHALVDGVPVDLVRQNLGHVILAGTATYIRSEEKRRMQAMQRGGKKNGPSR